MQFVAVALEMVAGVLNFLKCCATLVPIPSAMEKTNSAVAKQTTFKEFLL